MGQTQSAEEADANAATSVDDHSSNIHPEPSVSETDSAQAQSKEPPSMESLIAEAVAFGDESENESLDAKAQKALECPCIAGLRSGPCGTQFSDAFLCFLKSTAEEKGSDCVHPFVALQSCIKANPNAFSNDVLDNTEVKKEEAVKEYRILAPEWAVDSPSPKPPTRKPKL